MAGGSRSLAQLSHVVTVLTGGEHDGWQPPASSSGPFEVLEATIESIQAALLGGMLTSRVLVELYLKRIYAYNGQSCHYPEGLLGAGVEPVPESGRLNALSTINSINIDVQILPFGCVFPDLDNYIFDFVVKTMTPLVFSLVRLLLTIIIHRPLRCRNRKTPFAFRTGI